MTGLYQSCITLSGVMEPSYTGILWLGVVANSIGERPSTIGRFDSFNPQRVCCGGKARSMQRWALL